MGGFVQDLLESMRQDTVAEPRFYTVLLTAFAAAGLALAAIGIAGVIAYTVSQRRGEIGVRVALGASRHEVLTLVLKDGLKMSLAGAVLGTAGAVPARKGAFVAPVRRDCQ